MANLVKCPRKECTARCNHRVPHKFQDSCAVALGEECPACVPYEPVKGVIAFPIAPIRCRNKDNRYNSTLGV